MLKLITIEEVAEIVFRRQMIVDVMDESHDEDIADVVEGAFDGWNAEEVADCVDGDEGLEITVVDAPPGAKAGFTLNGGTLTELTDGDEPKSTSV